jgi:presenilin-like A22 family membrane protease
MKHKITITILLLGMFLVTQFIGLFVVNSYLPRTEVVIDPDTGEEISIVVERPLPYGMGDADGEMSFFTLVLAFIFAFLIIFLLMKYRLTSIIRIWFFAVVVIALLIFFNLVFRNFTEYSGLVALIFAVPFAYIKIFRPNFIIHNLTELVIYPGIASVLVVAIISMTRNPPLVAIGLLILISVYDMWAVWKSGIMQKMAKFQMEEVKVFGGFLVPSLSKKDRAEIKNIKQKYKGKNIPKKYKTKKFKINLAILGGGDIIFPIITAGIFMAFYGVASALFITFGAFAGLTYLMFNTEKGKSYPAMPYITTGIFIGIILAIILGFV